MADTWYLIVNCGMDLGPWGGLHINTHIHVWRLLTPQQLSTSGSWTSHQGWAGPTKGNLEEHEYPAHQFSVWRSVAIPTPSVKVLVKETTPRVCPVLNWALKVVHVCFQYSRQRNLLILRTAIESTAFSFGD